MPLRGCSSSSKFTKFKEFKARVENLTGKRIKALRTDRGTEYVNKEMASFLSEHGIRHDKTAPYTPQQNGVAERANHTIMECVLDSTRPGLVLPRRSQNCGSF